MHDLSIYIYDIYVLRYFAGRTMHAWLIVDLFVSRCRLETNPRSVRRRVAGSMSPLLQQKGMDKDWVWPLALYT